MPGMKQTLAERFFAKVNVNGPTPEHCPELGPCHVWTGHRNEKGYGRFRSTAGGRLEYTHRLAWRLHFGKAPEPCALHRCDNPACINTAHLFEGTIADNNRDMSAKGRVSRVPRSQGEAHHNAKLTDDDVRAIRMLVNVNSQRSVARCFGTKQGTVSNFVTGKSRATA